MRSQDWQDIDNVRNQAIAQLAEICAAMGLSWTATDGKFVIELPHIVAVKGSVTLVIEELPTKRKTFDISTWGDNSGIYEGEDDPHNIKLNTDGTVSPIDPAKPSHYSNPMPDNFQMPDYGEILDEGEAPKGDPSSES